MRSPMFRVLAGGVAGLLVASAPLAHAGDEPARPRVAKEKKNHDQLFGIDLGVDLPWMRIGSDAAVYEAPRYGGDARLFVREKDGDVARWRVYRGADYKRIVKARPDLGTNASLEILGLKLGGKVGLDLPKPEAAPRAGLQTYVTAPGMTYERASYDRDARLYVEHDDREYVYVGSDLEAIAKRHPEVAEHDGYATLRTRVKATPVTWRSQPTRETRSHVQVWSNPNGTTVRTWTYADGTWTRRQYEGASLEAILRENPEAAGTLRVWHDGPLASSSEKASAESATSAAVVKVAGAHLMAKQTEDGTCVIVKAVQPDTPAAALALAPGDKLIKIEGDEVDDLEEARRDLATALADGETTVEIRRGGKSMTVRLASAKTSG